MIYLLFYDTDNGDREEWNTFYTPCEAFEHESLRAERMEKLKSENPDLDFHTIEIKLQTVGEPKRSISEVFVSGMNGLEKGRLTLDDFLQLVDLVEKAVPGDARQHAFYSAMRTLASKVSSKT